MKKPNNKKKRKNHNHQKKKPGQSSSTTETPTTQLSDALDYKNKGNALFESADYEGSIKAYTKALEFQPDTALQATVYANRAQVHLKLRHYQQAEDDCTFVIDNLTTKNHKVFYRRALAREQLAHTSHIPRETLLAAKSDLETCLSLKNDQVMKQTVANVAIRLQLGLTTLKETQREQYRLASLPPKAEQKEAVLKLLSNPVLSEAFFLLDWHWWSHWVNYVNLFDVQEETSNETKKAEQNYNGDSNHVNDSNHNGNHKATSNGNNQMRTTTIQGLPPETKPPSKQRLLEPPGVIDNSSLLRNDNDAFQKHWYQFELRPNLLRGYDYEIVSREVYNALRLWYQEVTEPICRRRHPERLILYQLPPNNNNEPQTRCGNCGAPNATNRCRPCQQVFYCSRDCQERHWKLHKQQCGKRVLQPRKNGLNNLGNTCFMNSALQCLAHATPLSRYFLSGQFKADLNPQNPLGTGGKLAMAYEDVIRNLQMSSRSFSPMTLKRAIAVFAPRFAGCLQHDAQEFLAFLLDGLHEDLNRIRNPPYIEIPDVEGCIHIAGRENWITHRKRNDSLVLDTFYGQFKSTCVCPKCGQVSVSFDAFNHVSLEMPQRNAVVTVPVLLFRGPHTPVRYGISLRKTNYIRDLKAAIQQLTGIEVARQVVCEIMDSVIAAEFPNDGQISDLPTEVVAVYEVDPINDPAYCHMVASHRLVREKSEHLCGLPFLTSFPRKYSCREIWDHLWSTVERMADKEAKSRLQIRLTGRNGAPRPAFPETDEKEHKDGEYAPAVEISKSSLLPRDSDEPIATFLGEDLDRCIFVALEWDDVPDEESKSDHVVDSDRFVEFKEDRSWIEFEKKQKTNGEKNRTLQHCFDMFTNPERLDENNKWYCSKCKEHVNALKTMELWKLPNVLIVHLKRFEFKHALRRDKLDTLVDFPLEGLDMRAHCSSHTKSKFVDDRVPAVYDCFAVVNHFGRMGFGHYTAFARQWDESSIADEWNLFDDSSVRAATSDAVVSSAAYVLFYRRRAFT